MLSASSTKYLTPLTASIVKNLVALVVKERLSYIEEV
jgi:hypothetical protein